MISQLDRIGILVEDIATAHVIYDQLGLELVKRNMWRSSTSRLRF